MKLCKDCKYCVVENRECIHPNNFDVVTGAREAKLCDDMRSKGPCGLEGRWWWGKDVPDSVMQATQAAQPAPHYRQWFGPPQGVSGVSGPPERF